MDDPEEEEEKYILSLSILNFFKFASEADQTKVHLKNKQEILKKILYSEQQNTIYYKDTPIEVEDTYLGHSFDALRNAITGHESINPYNFVSFRILHRMANLLQGEYTIQSYDPSDVHDSEKIPDQLIENYRDSLAEKIKFEKGYWPDHNKARIEKVRENAAEFKQYQDDHDKFTNNNGV